MSQPKSRTPKVSTDPQAEQYTRLMRAARFEASNLKRQASLLADERRLLEIGTKLVATERDLLRRKTHSADTTASIVGFGGLLWFVGMDLASSTNFAYASAGNELATIGPIIAASGIIYRLVRMHFIDKQLRKLPNAYAKFVNTLNTYRHRNGVPNQTKYTNIESAQH